MRHASASPCDMELSSSASHGLYDLFHIKIFFSTIEMPFL